MLNSFGSNDTPYAVVYEALNEVREIFHREGRISDSNAKLEETVKLLSIHYACSKNLLDDSVYKNLSNRKTFSVELLNKAFSDVARLELFFDPKIGSIFGPRPSTAFDLGDENIAFELFKASGYALPSNGADPKNYDVLNEAFGHYVRDNFRSHVEDAQYMTPPEVVSFMVELACDELFGAGENLAETEFVMMDPSCGVGSFITTWRKEFDKQCTKINSKLKLVGVGQDKIERMARLSRINMIFSGHSEDQIFIGNSAYDQSPIDKFNSGVDLILTNPPFGAKFLMEDVRKKGKRSTPIFSSSDLSKKFIDSEILFLDRYLSLLRPGGLCLVVVPDGVISAKGFSALSRQHLAREAEILAVIELPSVAFAQAGTRTKTSILMFRKNRDEAKPERPVFFGEIENLGFEVSKKKGVPVKRLEGHNQLPDILEAYRGRFDRELDSRGSPITAVWRNINPRRVEAWTPRQFKSNRNVPLDKVDLLPLLDLVEGKQKRRPEPYSKGKLFISVLHVIGEGILDIAGVYAYQPITPGLPVNPGEVIISRLNPRIPRVLVVPDLGKPLLCSSEFEILKPRNGISPHAIAFLLMSDFVQEQILSLTAGTSASHSRVKPTKLYDVKMPWPTENCSETFDALTERYKRSSEAIVTALREIQAIRLRTY